MGAVIRDERGLILASCSKKLNYAYSAIKVEALAAVEVLVAAMALSLAAEIGIKNAILEGDSLVLIRALQEEACSLAPFGVLIKDVKDLSHSFDHLLYSHTKREGNVIAHSLARYAIGTSDFLVWMEDNPP